RNSSEALASSNSITFGSKKTFAAVRKSTPCFLRLASSLALSHSKSIASPRLEHTAIQYRLQVRRCETCFPSRFLVSVSRVGGECGETDRSSVRPTGPVRYE